MIRNVDIDFQFAPYIAKPPIAPVKLYENACSSDAITVKSWAETWRKNIKANHEKFGPFKERAISQIFGAERNKPVIVVGSGPSLKINVAELKDTKGIAVVSCLHNFHYLEDQGVKPKYYVNLDAGPVTLDEVYEGGTKTKEEYLEATKDHTLLTFTAAHPELLALWRGKIIFFNCPIPDDVLSKEIEAIEPFHQYISTGGNVLGACFYIAKAILGANPVIFTGADFCFSYDNKFHPWDSKYDKDLGQYMRVTDVFGMPRKTWQSYFQFKQWFDSRCLTVPGMYINATEGGTMGAYPEGNIEAIRQMSLKEVVTMYSISDHLVEQFTNPNSEEKKILF